MPNEPQEQETTTQEKPSVKKKRSPWRWVLFAVLVLVAAAGLLFAAKHAYFRVNTTDNAFRISFGIGTAPTESGTAERPGGGKGASHTLPIGKTLPTIPNLPMGGSLSLQQIYQKARPGMATILADGASRCLGTGIVMTEDGYIITNEHLVEQGSDVCAELADGRVLDAVLVGRDAESDLAVLQVQAQDLTPAEFGDSDHLQVGDWTGVISSLPNTDLRNIFTEGILSGISQSQTQSGRAQTLLQTDAATDSGVGGGALLNCHGQVVGVCIVRLRSGSADLNGITFAVPSETVKQVVEELISLGYVSGRPAIGVTVESLPVQAQIYYGLPDGAYVTAVSAGSDAEARGLRRGDIITALNGEAVTGPDSLRILKNQHEVGETVELTIFREGTRQTVAVTLTEQVTDR